MVERAMESTGEQATTGNAAMMPRDRLRTVTLAGVLLAAALAIQSLRIYAPVIGVLINALIIFMYHRGGFHGALLLGAATPIGAAVTGVLPVVFVGMVPVIAVGNLLFIVIYHYFESRTALVRFTVPACGKALFIGLAGFAVLAAFNIPEPMKPLSVLLLGQQFFTACLGIVAGERLCRLSGAGGVEAVRAA